MAPKFVLFNNLETPIPRSDGRMLFASGMVDPEGGRPPHRRRGGGGGGEGGESGSHHALGLRLGLGGRGRARRLINRTFPIARCFRKPSR